MLRPGFCFLRPLADRDGEEMSAFSFEAELAKGDAVKDAEYEAWKAEKIAEIGAWRFKTVVCRHWLKNACMNGDRCEYLHHYDKDRMPECHNGQDCNRSDCPFKHTAPRGVKECLFYKQGFCMHGPKCKFVHTKYAADALPKYGDYSTLFDGKEHERPENKPLGDLVDFSEIPSPNTQANLGSNRAAAQPPSILRREFPKNINYRTTICRMFAEGFCKHGIRCHFAHGQEMLRTREQNAEEFGLSNPFANQRVGRMGPGASVAPQGGNVQPFHQQNQQAGVNQGHIGRGANQVPLSATGGGPAAAVKSDLPDRQGGSYRYFIVRTPDMEEPDYETIMVSIMKGVWCTLGERAEMLSSAFRDNDHVLLFFTLGGSNLFQGCARMASEVEVVDPGSGSKIPVGFGEGHNAIFSVEWMKLCELEHRAVQDISYTELAGGATKVVPQASDFEELPAQTGSALLERVWKEEALEIDFQEVEVDPARFEGWGEHGTADPTKCASGEGSAVGSVFQHVKDGSEAALCRQIWNVEGPGFVVGCDGEMFGECFQRSLFGMPEEYKDQTRFIHKGTTLLLYNIDTKQLFGIFEALSQCMTLLEPNAFAPDNTTTTLYPVQVRFRVVAEVPPLEEDEIANLLGGGSPVRRVEPSVMQRLVDKMFEAGGGSAKVAMKNGLPIPGLEPDEADGKYREKLFIGDEIADDRFFRASQRIAGPHGRNMMQILNEVGMQSLRLRLVGRGAGQAHGGEESQDGLALEIEAENAVAFSKALNKCTDLIDHIREKHAEFLKGPNRGGNDRERRIADESRERGRGLDQHRDYRDRDDRIRSVSNGPRRGGPGGRNGGHRSLPPNARPGDWPCPRCGAHNYSSRFQCFKCRCPRPHGGRGPPPRDDRDAFDGNDGRFDGRRDSRKRSRSRSRSRDRYDGRADRSRSRSRRGNYGGRDRSRDPDRRSRDRRSRSRRRDRKRSRRR